MTDKNRQKGNESVGEKSDGLARDMDGLEALRKGADESREVFDGWYHAQIRNGMSPQDIAFNIHCANASNVRELAAYRYAALARPAPEALGAAKGVELSDAEIGAEWDRAWKEVTPPIGIRKVVVATVRAILAKAKGEQA